MPEATVPFADVEYWEERHRARPGQLAAIGHRKLDEAENRAAYAEVSAVIKGVITTLKLPAGSTLLDVGCGTGFFFPLFKELGLVPQGIDVSLTAVQVAQANNPGVPVRGMRVHKLRKESFTVVVALDVLYHITQPEEWEASMLALGRLTATGGHAILHETFAEDAAHLNPVPHICFRPQAEYRRMLKAGGLTVLEVQRYQSKHGAVKSLVLARK